MFDMLQLVDCALINVLVNTTVNFFKSRQAKAYRTFGDRARIL